MLRTSLAPHFKATHLRFRRITTSSADIQALDKWIATPQRTQIHDTLSEGHISDLFVTIPTRDGTRAAFRRPRSGSPLSPGHHLVFFHPRHPEHALRPDGTEPDFCPPEPFTRRMWVGGKIRWNHDKPLVVGGKATATWEIENVAKKGFEKESPMVFVNQRIRYRMEGMPDSDVCVDEERSHVYLAHAAKGTKAPREGEFAIPCVGSFAELMGMQSSERYPQILRFFVFVHTYPDYPISFLSSHLQRAFQSSR